MIFLMQNMKKALVAIIFIITFSDGYSQDIYRVSNIAPISVWKFNLKPNSNNLFAENIKLLLKKGNQLQFQYPDSALVYLSDALNESIASGDFEKAARAEMNMGQAFVSKGDFNSSFEHYEKAKKYVAISGSEKKLFPQLYVNIGTTYSFQGNYQKAFENYYFILQYMLKYTPNNENIAMAQNNIAEVLIRMRQYEKALYYIKQGESFLLNSKSESVSSLLLANKANIAYLTGKLDDLNKYSDAGIELALKYDDKEALQCLYILKGNYYLQTNNPQFAINYLKLALEGNNKNVYSLLAFVEPNNSLGLAYYQIGNYALAEKTIKQSLAITEALHTNADKTEALSLLYKIYEKTGQYKEALKINNINNLLKDSINEMEKKTLSNALEVRFRTEQKDQMLMHNTLLIEHQQRDLNQKNILLIGSIITLVLLTCTSIVTYLNFKNKNRITVLQAKMDAEEIERSRIAAELHDGIGGMLAAIKMRITSQQTQDFETVSLLNEASKQVRSTAHNLMPNIITDFTLNEAITHYVDSINHGQKDLKIDLEIHSEISLTKTSVKLSVYRMIQEIIQNIVKHSKASKAHIQLFEQPGKVHILVEDNGTGFDVGMVKVGFGLSNLRNRIELMNGILNIDSKPNAGTTIDIELKIS